MEKRYAKWDNIKLFLIFCVVIGHIGNTYGKVSDVVAREQFWVYLFHMPAFVFVAGLFSKKSIENKRYDRAISYFFLFIFMKFVFYLCNVAIGGVNQASLDFFHEDGVPWYALSMFWFYLITILIRDVHPLYVMVVSILLSFISGYSENVNSFLVMQRTINFFPFFYWGYITDVDKLNCFINKKYVKIVSLFIVSASIVLVWNYFEKISFIRSLFRGRYAYNDIWEDFHFWHGLWRIGAFAISAILMVAIFSLIPSVHTILSDLGKRTLSVFVFHYVLMTLVLRFCEPIKVWLEGDLTVRTLIFTLIIILVTSLPIFLWPLKKLMTIPKRNDAGKK